jgi:DNA primase
MAGRIAQKDIEEVRQRTNIADVIGEYVQLKGAGAGELKGLCPFHDEKSPSFTVSPSKGFYHCFGCKEGGNVFEFVAKLDSLSFREVVEKLAARLGMTPESLSRVMHGLEAAGLVRLQGRRVDVLDAKALSQGARASGH